MCVAGHNLQAVTDWSLLGSRIGSEDLASRQLVHGTTRAAKSSMSDEGIIKPHFSKPGGSLAES